MSANLTALRQRSPQHPALSRLDTIAQVLIGRPDATTADAIDWLKSGSEPSFMFLQYYSPHYPYDPPAGYAERFGGLDDGRINFTTALCYDLMEMNLTDEEADALLASPQGRQVAGELALCQAAGGGASAAWASPMTPSSRSQCRATSIIGGALAAS